MNLEKLTRYKSWADSVFYESLRGLADGEIVKDRSMLFGNILALLNHVYAMDVVWSNNLQGKDHNMNTRNPAIDSTFDELLEKQRKINVWYEEYISQQGIDQLNESVSFTFIGGGSGQMLKNEIIHHAVNHASYHRGHIEGVMYQLSVEPPITDLPVFLQLENSSNHV